MLTIPNAITLFRVLLTPVGIVAILHHQWWLALGLFAIAGISDFADGFIARRFAMQSRAGALLDPLADKIMLVALYPALGWAGVIPLWLAGLVAIRDILLLAAIAYFWLAGQRFSISPLPVGKATTAVQIAYGVLAVWCQVANWSGSAVFVETTAWLVAGLTIVSTLAYVHSWRGGRR